MNAAAATPATSRRDIVASGSFVAIPDAFPNAALQDAVKFECTTTFSEPHRFETLVSTDRVLIDLAAVLPTALDFKKLAADCDLLKEIALKHPDGVKECLTALKEGGSEGVRRAEAVAKKIGLTEEQFAQQGGGFFFVVALIGIAVAAGGCATVNTNKPFKQSTTPKPRKPISSGGGTTPPPQ